MYSGGVGGESLGFLLNHIQVDKCQMCTYVYLLRSILKTYREGERPSRSLLLIVHRVEKGLREISIPLSKHITVTLREHGLCHIHSGSFTDTSTAKWTELFLCSIRVRSNLSSGTFWGEELLSFGAIQTTNHLWVLFAIMQLKKKCFIFYYILYIEHFKKIIMMISTYSP